MLSIGPNCDYEIQFFNKFINTLSSTLDIFLDYSLLEGDIVMYNDVEYQSDELVGEAISQEAYKWPMIDGLVQIPYETTLRITDEKMENITKAMEEYSRKTCVR